MLEEYVIKEETSIVFMIVVGRAGGEEVLEDVYNDEVKPKEDRAEEEVVAEEAAAGPGDVEVKPFLGPLPGSAPADADADVESPSNDPAG